MEFVGQILLKLEMSSIRGFLQLYLPYTGLCGMEVWKLIGAICIMREMSWLAQCQWSNNEENRYIGNMN